MYQSTLTCGVCDPFAQHSYMHLGSAWYVWGAGVIARTVKDVILFDSIFSDCHYPRPDLMLKGTRLGYPVNYWKGLDTRVRAGDNKL